MTTTLEDFWQYSLSVYAKPLVQPALLYLQDEHQADINILLLCCYSAAGGHPALNVDFLLQAQTLTEPWRTTITEPLRALRRCLKQETSLMALEEAAEIRAQILEIEVRSERMSLRQLHSLLETTPTDATEPPIERAAWSLRTYLNQIGCRWQASVRNALETLLNACFEDDKDAVFAISQSGLWCDES